MIHFYSCKDLKETELFWKKLGLKVFMRQPNTIIFDSEKGMIGFVQKKIHEAPHYSCVSFVYETQAEVDFMYEQWKEEALDIPQIHPTAPVYSFFIKDPNGILVEFQQFI